MKPDFTKGLIPAIVVDAATKMVLMLAYMNETAYEKTLQTRETWFYSRSRQQLWHKGATSGNTQKVVSIVLDCDQDTLLIEVNPNGPACHTGATTCFFNEVQNDSRSKDFDPTIFDRVFHEILTRKTSPQEGSYTNYLFDKGTDKIGKKIIEEAGEVVIASKNNAKEELTLEVSDLLYHTFVMLAEKDVDLADIKAELTKRFSKKGNSKGDRPSIDQW
ncbi:bifunctional phosphoribosyl-AMP cyclohydrolase/phosphoribosyl-ATP diphosphatase HisIE [Amphibacillus jilinensis]|uniref:bifunctional phosphoribosyl-AMP cyclohydrolase/phosphoribosyl-ATP diphosphatase HisIE n=1 Tax=Amphibacillus jilinensis TaxID=1216008 RepID=UPI0002FF6361|nr:bifunctional phosphoribosyl-AMP cyclohydrolase/phosphoribosyl-ATP diphosphatase HisIE [Amphibacillus jilinensis]